MTDKYLLERQNQKLGLAAPRSGSKERREAEKEDKKKSEAWFKARHKEMKGYCIVCGGKTCKGMDEYKNSAAHLFPKAYFESIKWNEENWIELCFYGCSCHTNFDNKILALEDLQVTPAWPEIVRKTRILYPLMTNSEQGRVPDILIQEIEKS